MQRAAQAADQGFAAGVLAPTIALLEADGLAEQRDGLARFQEELGQVPGVAGVVGPRELPVEVPGDVLVSENGSAARVAVIWTTSLGSKAIKTVREARRQAQQSFRSPTFRRPRRR